MQAQGTQPLAELWIQFSAFLPTLAAGLLVIAVGLIAGWLAKRAVVRTLVWLRLDRLAGRVGWRAGLGKGDVRAALYNVIGSVVMLVVVLVFVDDALNRLGLVALARIIDALVFYLPNLALVALVLGVGVALSNALSGRVAEALEEEGVAQARLIGKALKGALLSVVLALALWQLQFAREIVLSAFLICFGSLGVAFAIGAGLGTARAIERGLTQVFQRKSDGS
jgi:hypothetical protein